MTYRIKDWDRVFESHQERKRITGPLAWVRIPTDGGLTLKRLMRTDAGAEAYGVFVALVRIAARMSIRGVLARSDGSPLSVDDLEDLTDIPATVIRRSIDILTSERIGWLKCPDNEGGDRAENGPERADIGVERADIDLHRAENGPERADTAQISSKMRDRGEEKRKEKMRGEETHARAEPSPAEKDIFDNRPSMPIPDRELIRPLAPYVRWKGSDPDGTEDNIAELIGLIHRYGAKEVLAAAIACRESARDKVWPNMVGEHLMSQGDLEAPQDDFGRPLPPVCQQAIAVVRATGFPDAHAACPQIDPTGDNAKDLARLIRLYESGNQPAAKEILDAIKART